MHDDVIQHVRNSRRPYVTLTRQSPLLPLTTDRKLFEQCCSTILSSDSFNCGSLTDIAERIEACVYKETTCSFIRNISAVTFSVLYTLHKFMTIAMAVRSTTHIFFDYSKSGIVGSYPIRPIDIFPYSFYDLLSYFCKGFAMGWVLPIVCKVLSVISYFWMSTYLNCKRKKKYSSRWWAIARCKACTDSHRYSTERFVWGVPKAMSTTCCR